MQPVRRPSVRRSAALVAAVLLAVVLALAARPSAARAEGAGMPAAAAPVALFVKELVGRIYGASHDAALSPAGRRAKLRQLVDRGFDVPHVARFVLGRHWGAASAAERAEFTAVFADYMVATYTPQMATLGEYGYAVTVTGQRADSDATTVFTSLPQRSGRPLRIDWRTVQAAGGYRITDIMVGGISLMETKRDEIAAVIARGGVEGMIAEIRGRADQVTAQE